MTLRTIMVILIVVFCVLAFSLLCQKVYHNSLIIDRLIEVSSWQSKTIDILTDKIEGVLNGSTPDGAIYL